MKVTEPEYESVVVLYVHVGGCVVWEGVDVIGGVVLTFEDIVFKTVKPLVYRGTESRKVSRKGLVMCCCVVE